MNGLELLLIVLVWWIIGGWYARHQAISRNLLEQPSLLSAMLQGPIWVRRMLIWSAVSSKHPDQASQDSTEEERTRGNTPVNSPAAMLNPLAAAGGQPPSDRFKPPSQTPQAAPGATVPEPAAPAVPEAAPAPVAQHRNPIPAVPEAAPAPVVQQAAPTPTVPEAAPTPVVPGAAPTPTVPEAAPAPVVPGAAPAAPMSQPQPAPSVSQALPPADIPAGVAPPKRLPGKPLFGKVKTLCPWCESKQSFDKQAVCESCGQPNPWLVEKWKLTPQAAPQTAPQAAPPAAPQVAHQVAPQAAPQVAPQAAPPSAPQVAPQTVPQAAPQAAPQVAPQDAPQVAPQVAPQAAPQVVPQAAPQVAPPATGSEAAQVSEVVEDAHELPPAGAVQPKRLPGKPLVGSVKSLCPWCGEKRSFDKQATCAECGKTNPWLADKWGLTIQPAPPAHGPSAAELAALQKVRVEMKVEDEALVELDPDQEIEAFDTLPSRPKIGKVSTVCPSCHQRGEHNREGVCQNCNQPNDWLRKRWGLVEMGAQVEASPVGPAETTPDAVVIDNPNLCPGCGRSKAADLDGQCIFCGEQLEEIG